jgi:hypothetical protein
MDLKGPLGIPRHTWEDIKIDLKRRGYETVNSIHLA